MALDSYDRINALNAVVEAWTKYGSLPFITRKYLASGASAVFDVTTPFRGFIVTFGAAQTLEGLYMINVTTTGSSGTIKAVAAASGISVTYSTANKQITITASGGSSNTVIIPFAGIVEEV